MQWIKKNLFFVIGGVIALALMVFAILYVLDSMKNSSGVQEEINQQITELQRLYDKEPFPSDENIAVAKQEQQRLEDFLAQAKAYFASVPPFPATDNHGFQELLGTTIYDLQKQASATGVILPPQYAFTFSGQRNALQLSPASINPWLTQLSEIKTICSVLYQSKIIELYGLRRIAVTDDDRRQQNTADYLPNEGIVTNQTAIFAPYEISFRGFSSELASVLSGFLQSSNCILVKSVSIEPAPFVQSPNAAVVSANPAAAYAARAVAPPVSAAPSEDRYGGAAVRPAAPVRQYAAPAVAKPAAIAPAITVLQERPLRITMLIETVKLRERKN